MLHISRVQAMQPHIDNTPPASWVSRHGRVNAKRITQNETRQRGIDHENQRLVQRLGTVANRQAWDPKTSIMFSYPTGRGCATKDDVDRMQRKTSNPFMEQRHRVGRIVDLENQKIFKRIETVSAGSVYSRDRLLKEDAQRRALSARMSRYSRPNSASQPNSTAGTGTNKDNRDILMRSAKKLIPASKKAIAV